MSGVPTLSKITLPDLTSSYRSAQALNEALANIENEFDNTLSLDGSAPNSMEADFDINGNRILNLPEPTEPTDAVRLEDLDHIIDAETARAEAAEAAAQARADAAYALAESLVGGTVVAGGTFGSVASIAALTALDPTPFANGEIVNVKSYLGGNAYGGGLFRWDQTSTEETDGGLVFCPDALLSDEVTETVTIANIINRPPHYYQMAHTDVVFGTFFQQYDNDKWASSWWYSGHTPEAGRSYSIASAGIDETVTTEPILQCKLGRIRGAGLDQFAQIMWTNTNTAVVYGDRTSDIRYKYATAPGRWVRVLNHLTHLTPSMFGGVPNDETVDNSLNIQWMMQGLVRAGGLSKWNCDDGQYTLKGYGGDIYSNTENVFNIKYMGSQHSQDAITGHQGGSIDFLSQEFLTDGVEGKGSLNLRDDERLYFLLKMRSPGFTVGENATNFTLYGSIDGNYSENEYALTDILGDGDFWDPDQTSQKLRESNTYMGIAVINQGGRRVLSGLRWYHHDLTVINMWGSCIIDGASGAIGTNLLIGPSVSGRTLYGSGHRMDGVTFRGYSRTSFLAGYGGFVKDMVVERAEPNPWASNSDDPTAIGMRGRGRTNRIIDDADLFPGISRYSNDELLVDGLSINWTVPASVTVRSQGERLDLVNANIKGPPNGPHNIIVSTTETAALEPISGPHITTLRYHNRSIAPPVYFSGLLTQDTVFRDVHITESFASPILNLRTHELDNASWTKTGATITANAHDDQFSRTIIDRIVESATTGEHQVSQNASVTANHYVVLTCEAYPDTNDWVWMRLGSLEPIFFNANTFEFGYVPATCVDYGEEGGLAWAVFRATATAATSCSFGTSRDGTGPTSVSYAGNTSNGIFLGNCRVRQYRDKGVAFMGPTVIVAGVADTGNQPYTFVPDDALLAGHGLGTAMLFEWGPEPVVAEQEPIRSLRYRMEGVVDETNRSALATLSITDPITALPVTITYKDCDFRLMTNAHFGGTNPSTATNLRVEFIDCVIDTRDPALVGTDQAEWAQIHGKTVMKGVRTHDGRVSEFSEDSTITVVASGAVDGEINDGDTLVDIQTPLLWSPLDLGAIPLSPDAITAGVASVAVQITGTNYHTPLLRITFVTPPTTGAVLKYRLSGAVLPERTL